MSSKSYVRVVHDLSKAIDAASAALNHASCVASDDLHMTLDGEGLDTAFAYLKSNLFIENSGSEARRNVIWAIGKLYLVERRIASKRRGWKDSEEGAAVWRFEKLLAKVQETFVKAYIDFWLDARI